MFIDCNEGLTVNPIVDRISHQKVSIISWHYNRKDEPIERHFQSINNSVNNQDFGTKFVIDSMEVIANIEHLYWKTWSFKCKVQSIMNSGLIVITTRLKAIATSYWPKRIAIHWMRERFRFKINIFENEWKTKYLCQWIYIDHKIWFPKILRMRPKMLTISPNCCRNYWMRKM